MKIVCESCGAKYSISDDRVVGKMFKIRCKKCSEVIVVRGDQPQAAAEAQAPEASAGGAPGQTAIWHVVVEGEQAGPYAPAQLADMLTNGTVDWEAYVWTEGFDNWLPMRDVPDLVSQITGQPAQPAAAAASAANYRSQQATLTGQPSMGADPFAEDSAGNDSGMFGAQAAASDLFARNPAQASASSFGSDDPGVVSSSPSPRLSAERVLTGARNENSVLFSLKNLQSLATGSAAPSAPPFTAAAAERGGFAGGEGSGLIDIRALASTTGMGASADGQKDELLSIGSQGGAFGTLGSPMMAASADDGDGSKKLMIWAAVAGVGFLSIAIVVVALIMRPSVAPAATASVGVAPAAAPGGAAPGAPTTVPTAAPAPGTAPTTAPSEGELAAAAAKKNAEQAARSGDSDTARSNSGSSEHRKKHEGATAKPASDAVEAPVEPKKAPPTKSGPRSIDDLLDGALSGNSSGKPSGKTESAAASDANLPSSPSRDQAMSAMNGVRPAVLACAKGQTGVATVAVSVAGTTGRVTTAQVNGVTGPAGSCIAQAVRKAQFPKFKQAVFKLAYPYKL